LFEPLFEQSLGAIQEGWNIIDAGAGIGHYTLVMAIKTRKGRVFAFECHQDIVKVLRKNIELHKLKNITIIQKALTDKHGERIQLWETPSYGGSFVRSDKLGITRAHFGRWKRKLVTRKRKKIAHHIGVVETETIDHLRNSLGLKIHMILMDIQGMEEKALLKGAYNVLTNDKPLLLIEIHSPINKRRFLEVLQRLGYNLTTEQYPHVSPTALWVKGELGK